MFDTIIVGHDGGAGGADALALGRLLARSTGAELLAAHVYDVGPSTPPPGYARWGALAHDNARAVLSRALGDAPDVRGVPVQSSSVARGLHEIAEGEQADLIVVGSSLHAGLGRVLAGSVGERVVHGSPCGVAVAPVGYAEQEPKLDTIGVGFDGLPESEAALQRAAAIAQATGARLELLSLVELPETPRESKGEAHAGEGELARAREEHMQSELVRGLQLVPSGVTATGEVLEGRTETLGQREDIDVLVVGSRGYGPLKRVLLGSVATHLIRTATNPLIVYPRGSAQAAETERATAGSGSRV